MLLDIVKKGTNDYSCVIRIVDATDGTPETGVVWNTAGIDLWYRRPQAAHTSITEATQTEGGAHTDGGFVHISDGYYRLDLPDAAVATGVDYVDVGGTVTGMIVIGGRINLVDNTAGDVYTRLGAPAGASVSADIATVDTVVDGIQTDLSNGTDGLGAIKADTAAILVDTGTSGVLVSSGTGTGQISLSSGEVTPTAASKTGYRLSATGVDDIWDEALSGHVAAGSTGAALFIVRSGAAQAGASTTITLDASASAVDDFYNDQAIYIVSGTGVGQGRIISDYNGTTKVATVSTWATTPDATSVFVIRPFGAIPGASAPTAAQVADAVWDEAMADHQTEGSFGTMLQSFHEGTAQAASSTSITLDATGSSATTDFYRYSVIEIVSGTGANQSRQITAYNGTSKVATVDPAWTTTPSTDSQYVVKGLGLDAATTAQIADAVWDEARSGHVAAGSFGEYVLADATRISGSTSAADGLENAVAGSTPLPANVTQISGDATAADNLEAYTDGTTPMPVNATQISGDATAADNAEAFFDGTGYAGTNNVIPTVTTVGSVSGAVGSVTGNVGGNVLGTVAELGTQAKADVNAEVVDALITDTYAEPAAVPAATSSIKDKINWLFALARNKMTQTATTQALRNDADGANIGTSTQADDGTTYTRGEWS